MARQCFFSHFFSLFSSIQGTDDNEGICTILITSSLDKVQDLLTEILTPTRNIQPLTSDSFYLLY